MSRRYSHNSTQRESYRLVEQIVSACRDAKGRDVAVLDVSYGFDLADYFVVVSGRSDRHVQGICHKITSGLQIQDQKPLAVEGFDDGHWVLMDCGEVIIHVFYEPMRTHYDIEGLWLKAERIHMPESPSSRTDLQAA